METKLFEVRDSGTFIPVICVKLQPGSEAERYLLSRSGYGVDAELQAGYVLFGGLIGGTFEYDPGGHHNRTRTISHSYIRNNWEFLNSGDVIDVEYISGETSHKKLSEAVK